MKKIDLKMYKNEEIILSYNDLNVEYVDGCYQFLTEETLNFIKKNKNTLEYQRKNSDYEFKLIINENPVCTYNLKEQEYTLNIQVNKATFIEVDNILVITYNIESNEETIKIEIQWKE